MLYLYCFVVDSHISMWLIRAQAGNSIAKHSLSLPIFGKLELPWQRDHKSIPQLTTERREHLSSSFDVLLYAQVLLYTFEVYSSTCVLLWGAF